MPKTSYWTNPRSVLFQVAELREQIERLPGGIEDGQLSVTAKAVLELHTQLRVAEPEDVAHAIVFLASPRGANISGQALPVDADAQALV